MWELAYGLDLPAFPTAVDAIVVLMQTHVSATVFKSTSSEGARNKFGDNRCCIRRQDLAVLHDAPTPCPLPKDYQR